MLLKITLVIDEARGIKFNTPSFTGVARVAQSVEQRIENPCVDGSIPPPGTISKLHSKMQSFK